MLTFAKSVARSPLLLVAFGALPLLGVGCSSSDASNGDSTDAGKSDGSKGGASPGTDAGGATETDSGSTGDDDTDATVQGDSSAPPGDDDASDPLSGTVSDAGVITGAPIINQLLGLTTPCTGANIVSKHTYQGNNGKPVDICKLNGAVYYTAKMAIDCDGRTTPNCPGTGANKDCCYFNDTSFHNPQGQPLAAEYDPYVVIPQDFFYPGLDQDSGGNIIAVIYKGQLEFAVFGDQGPTDLIGESSFRTAANLGINSSPASGGVDGDVTYIVFTGTGVQPKDMEDQSEIQKLGASLVKQLVSNN